MEVLVIGYGNPFREDDAVGHQLAPEMKEALEEAGHSVRLLLEQQLLPELTEEFRGKDRVLFVDAHVAEEPVEESYRLVRVEPAREGGEGLNIHSFGPDWLLHLAETVGTEVPEAWLLSVAGSSFNFSEELSPPCRRRTEEALTAFRRWVARGMA
ncbi:MAG: hydrogenase maturation protease [Synergistales bacterium]|nr:hydrogenase maturation protease [Synergistales bacterium]